MKMMKLFVLLHRMYFYSLSARKSIACGETVVQVRVLDETNAPLAGVLIKLCDKKGIEKFKKNNLALLTGTFLINAYSQTGLRFPFCE